MPRLLFIGDIVGRPGRDCVLDLVSTLRKDRAIDLVIANAENSAGGSGLTAAIANNLSRGGIDGITLGDHVWDQRGFDAAIDNLSPVCRPANLPEQCPGQNYLILTHADFRLAVFTVLGRQFLRPAECPFLVADRLIKTLKDNVDAIFVEIHAEATSEKIAMGWYLDGRVAAVIGTHTHVPTADARLLPRGTAYMTDVGMTGPYASVLGRQIEPVVARFLDGMPRRFPVAENEVRLCGCIVDINTETGLADFIEPLSIEWELD